MADKIVVLLVLGYVALLLVVISVYFILILSFVIGFLLIKSRNFNQHKKITLIIPFRNEAHQIQNLVKSINQQSLHEFALVMVDDHSSDESKQIIAGFAFREGIEVKLIGDLELGGKSVALQRGITEAKTKHVVITDADCIFSKEWLKEIQNSIQEKQEIIIAPVLIQSNDFFSSVQLFDQLALTASSLGSTSLGFPIMCSGANLSFCGADYNRTMTSFNGKHGDDMWFLHKSKTEEGMEFYALNTANAIVYTKAEDTLFSFLKQRIRWGSKAVNYSDFMSQLTAYLVFFSNALLLIGLLISAFHPVILPYLLFSLGLKVTIDFLLLFLAWRRLKVKATIFYFFPAFVFHLLYVPIVGIAGLFWKTSWKDRN